MSAQVHVAGTRTFAAEVVDSARAAGLDVIGLLEPSDPARVGTTIHGLPVRSLEEGPGDGPAEALIGTGDADRREIVARLRAAGWRPASVIHPRAHLPRGTAVGAGVFVGPGVVLGACVRLGDHVVLGRGALVGHHTEIGAFATLGPGANVAGNVRVGDGAHVAMGALVRDHLTIGAGAVVAMGAVVVADVPAGVTVRGLPAR